MRFFLHAILCFLILASAVPWAASAQEAASTEAAATDAEAVPPEAAGLPAEQARALAEALKTPEARDALIRELERIAGDAPAGEAATTETAQKPEAPAEQPKSIGRRIAETTQSIAAGIVDGANAFGVRLARSPDIFVGLSGAEVGVLLDALLELAVIIVATVATYFLLRRFGKRLFRRMGERASEKGLIETSAIVLVSVMVDIAIVLLAWAAGYVLATLAIGDFGAVGIRQALYLNAFLVVELVKVGMRTILSPTTAALRPIAIPDGGARRLTGWLSVVVSVLGYGQLLIVPIVSQHVSWLAGQGMGVLISIVALALLMAMTLSHRRRVSEWLLSARHMAAGPRAAAFLARWWHVPVVLYLIALFLIVLTRPGAILLPVLGASLQILGAIVVGSMSASAISRSIRKGIHLPPTINERLPLLESRLNAFVPNALIVLQVLIILAVLAFAFHTVGLLDLRSWLEGQVGAAFTATLISVGLILLGAFAVWLAFSSYIDWRLNPDYGTVPTARARTLLTLGKNAATIVLMAVTLMFVLSEIGIDIAPLIASAGVLGLAIGFGSQKMVQDIITGIFIQFENAMNVGDVVTVGGTTGTVERLTIRSVSLRDLHGVFHIIPFSSVDMVSNYMRGFSQYVCDMGIAYREDVAEAKQAMFDAFSELREMEEWGPFILADLEWFGLQAFGDSAVVLRARIRCSPGKQWAVGRAYNEVLKRVFDDRGIEIPFPHQTIYFGEDKQGKAPPAHILLGRAEETETAEAPALEEKPAEPEPEPETPPAEGPKRLSDAPPAEAPSAER